MLKHEDYIKRIKAHMKADNFIRRETWDGSKGCAIGCTFEYYDHARAAKETNVPEWLWRLEDALFEGMSEEKTRTWPLEFFKRINFETPDDIWQKKVMAPFMIVVLESTLDTFDHAKSPDVKAAIDSSIALWQRGDIGSDDWKKAAANAAWAAAWAANAAAEAANAANAAALAAAKAARAAANASWAAAEAARAAAANARAAKAAADAAAWAAEAAKYDYFADELLRILDEAKEKKGA